MEPVYIDLHIHTSDNPADNSYYIAISGDNK
jgi:hypothetical protein